MEVHYVKITCEKFFFEKVIFLDFMSYSFLRIFNIFSKNEGYDYHKFKVLLSLVGSIHTVFYDILLTEPEFSDFAILKWPEGP